MSKTCDRCGKELTERDRVAICLECEVALADEVIKNLEAENAALREQLAAAEKKAEKYAKNLSETIHKAYEIFAENEVLRAIAESCGFDVRLVNKEASEDRGGQEGEG